MLKRLALSVVQLSLVAPLAGCFVVARPAHRRGGPACHPSQYGDGHQCRHKGNGHGARKHDGRRK